MNSAKQARIDNGIAVAICAIVGAIIARFELIERRHDRKQFAAMVYDPYYNGTTGKFICETCGRNADLVGHKRGCIGRRNWFGSCRLIIGPAVVDQVRQAGGWIQPDSIDAKGSASGLTTREIATALPHVIDIMRFGPVGQAQLLVLNIWVFLPQLSEQDFDYLCQIVGGLEDRLERILVAADG